MGRLRGSWLNHWIPPSVSLCLREKIPEGLSLQARRHEEKKGEVEEAQEAQEAELGLGGPGGEGRVQLGDPRGPRGPGVRVYHVCDDGVMSTRRLVEVLAEGMGRPARLLSVPRWAAMTVGTLLGKGGPRCVLRGARGGDWRRSHIIGLVRCGRSHQASPM